MKHWKSLRCNGEIQAKKILLRLRIREKFKRNFRWFSYGIFRVKKYRTVFKISSRKLR